MRATAQVVAGVLGAMLTACPPPKGEPALELTLTPKNVTDATPVKVRVVGTAGDGKVGSGTVKITSARGSLTTPAEVQLDTFGSATAELICDPTTEPGCANSVRVVGEWTSDGVSTSGEARLNSGGPAGAGGGAGGGVVGTSGGGAGGGSGGGGGGGGAQQGKPYFLGNVFRDGTLLGRGVHDLTPGEVNRPIALVPAGYEEVSMAPNGDIYYFGNSPRRVLRVVKEPLSDWSRDAFANDVELQSPCGPQGDDIIQFDVFPDTGAQAFVCRTRSNSSAAVQMGLDDRFVALGWDGYVMVVGQMASSGAPLSIWKAGQRVATLPWTMPASSSLLHVTAVPDGFVVNLDCSLYRTDFAGTTTSLGQFSGLIPQSSSNGECCHSAIAPDARGYLNSVGGELTGLGRVIGKCSPGGNNTALYWPENLPPTDWTIPVVPPSFQGSVFYR